MNRGKGYWLVEVTKDHEAIYRRRLAGNLSDREVGEILQRLASRSLSLDEVVSASVRKAQRTSLLDVRVDHQQGKRKVVWLPALSDYHASHWREDELTDLPEISGTGE